MFSTLFKFTLCAILGTIISYRALAALDDYQIILSHSSIDKLVTHLIPTLTQHIRNLTIPSQTFEGTATMELGEITVHNISIQDVAVDLDSIAQTIGLKVIHMTLELNKFPFKATAFGVSFLSCEGFLTPAFINWNMSVVLETSTNDCNISLQFIDSETSIEGEELQLNQEFPSSAGCNAIFAGADFFLDIEQKLKETIMKEIPTLINNDLQAALDAGLRQSQTMGDIGICYNNVTIYTDHLLIAGDFIVPKVEDVDEPSNISTTEFVVIDPDEPINDDSSLFVFFIIIAILTCMIGCGTGVGIFCACNNDKIKKVRLMKGSDDTLKVNPIRINDMTDDEAEFEAQTGF